MHIPFRKRSIDPLPFDDWLDYFSLDFNQTLTGDPIVIGSDWSGLVSAAYRSSPVVFACVQTRMLAFSEARLKWRQVRQGLPGQLFGSAELAPLENPWPGGTTSDLLSRALLDVDLAGNFYCVKTATGVARLRPDYVRIVIGSPDNDIWSPQAEVIGYIYKTPKSEMTFAADEVAHFMPYPDPLLPFKGMPWLTPVLRDVIADREATEHKLRYFAYGATPNLIIQLSESDKAKFLETVNNFKTDHEGTTNAYKTLFTNASVDVKTVGNSLKDMDYRMVQAAGETRIAAAAGTPPMLVGLSEGLSSANYAVYSQARKRFVDGTVRPLLRNFCGSMQRLFPPPQGAELWFDETDVALFREDSKDRADTLAQHAQTIRQLTDGGYKPDSVVSAVINEDLSLLEHTDLYSVQLQAPVTSNGKVPDAQLVVTK
jgi:phage portal protein BeeE